MHLHDTRIPMKLKEKVYQMAILQAILYGCQNVGQVKKNKKKCLENECTKAR